MKIGHKLVSPMKKESESSAEQIERIATVLARVFIRQAELQLRKGV